MSKKKEETDVIETEAITEELPPNVAFVGKEWRTDAETGKEKLMPSRFAPEKVNTATKVLRLPPSEVQTAGAFHSEHAAFLISNFPDPNGRTAGVFYKAIKAKGD